MSRDYPTDAERQNQALHLLADTLSDLNETVQRLCGHIDQARHRLGTAEQDLVIIRQRLANVEHASSIKDTTTDRAIAALMNQVGAVLIELEPNGQPKATGFKGSFSIQSEGGYAGDAVWEARGEVGAPMSHALVGLNAYIYHSRQDQFAGSASERPSDLPSNAVRQAQSEGEVF